MKRLWGISLTVLLLSSLLVGCGRTERCNPYLLDLLSQTFERSGNELIVQGEVKNISDGLMYGIKVLTKYYDAEDNIVRNVEVSLDDQELHQGEVSQFRIVIIDDPKIDRYELSFKWGGEIIQHLKPYKR